ncbi:MAG: hypothetical protein CMI25_00760 [Opitutae bacterium]|nr:hypothetical protein [Opitutae bacterium]
MSDDKKNPKQTAKTVCKPDGMGPKDFLAYPLIEFRYFVMTMNYEYKSISLTPDGIRVKGDDITEKLAAMINEVSNSNGKKGWRLISVIPSLKSEGAVVRLLVTFEREVT